MGLFIQHAHEQSLVHPENCVECFHSEFLGLAYTAQNREHLGILLVCWKQLAACSLVKRYARRTEFRFKVN